MIVCERWIALWTRALVFIRLNERAKVFTAAWLAHTATWLCERLYFVNEITFYVFEAQHNVRYNSDMRKLKTVKVRTEMDAHYVSLELEHRYFTYNGHWV